MATATATKGDSSFSDDDDAHATFKPRLGITIDKSGPTTATPGQTVTYQFAVTNTGTAALHDVAVSDDTLDTPDDCAFSSTIDKALADGDDLLEPGETWGYSCSITLPATAGTYRNVGTVVGKGPNGEPVTSKDQAATTVVVERTEPSRNPVVGDADFVNPPKGCVRKRDYTLHLTGRDVASVTYRLDGKVAKRLRNSDSRGRYSLNAWKLINDTKRHVVTAEVLFTRASGRAKKTVRVNFQRCACLSRRAFVIRLVNPKNDRIVSARASIKGKKMRVLKGRRVRVLVRLLNLPRGAVKLRIVAKTAKGRTIRGSRTYYPCQTRVRKRKPKL